jgi:CheY-like chemotaxis protein
MIRIRAEHKDIVFVYENDPNLPVGVYADEKRLREVLINLLDNAVKFTEKGKVIFKVTKFETRNVEHEARKLGSENEETLFPVSSFQFQTRIRFEVEDTGIGIASEQLETIFLPFQQVGKYRYSTEGTGLGLAISQQLVKMMGGELYVESVVSEGSTFWFELDLPEILELCPKTWVQQPEIIGYRGAQRTIMIVDDQQENRAVLRNMLFPLGFEILETENGQECLDMVARSTPDLILLDLLMPEIDGFETAKRIREMPEIRDMKIIAISASVFEETRERSLEAGCDDFLAKPIEEEILLERLQIQLNLEWVYRDDFGGDSQADKPSFSTIDVSLPTEEADILRKLAVCGNITRLLEQLKHLETLGEHYLPLVTELRKFAKSFQVQNIVKYLEHLEKHHEG